MGLVDREVLTARVLGERKRGADRSRAGGSIPGLYCMPEETTGLVTRISAVEPLSPHEVRQAALGILPVARSGVGDEALERAAGIPGRIC